MIIMAMTRNRNLQNIVMTPVNMSFWGGKGSKKWVQRSIFQNPLLDGSPETKQHIFKTRPRSPWHVGPLSDLIIDP